MRSLVLSDVHADADALDRVLRDATGGWDRLLLLGDMIGYGPEPVRSVARLRGLAPAAAVLGNHEAMLAELIGGRRPNATPAIVTVLEAHAAALGDDDVAWLTGLPLRAVLPAAGNGSAGVGLVHGNPDPDRPFDHMLGVPAARRAAIHADRPVTFYGHTHVPGGFVEGEGGWRPVSARRAETTFRVPPGSRAFLNPGSVAPARDGGPGGCYMIFDHASGEARIRRVGDGRVA